MDRLLLTYHPVAAFVAGRIADRLTLRLGEEAISVVHPHDTADPDRLSLVLANHAGLVIVVPSASDGAPPAHHPHVHLMTSLAIRRGQPIMVARLSGGDPAEPRASADAAEGSGVVHLEIDPDQLDVESDRMISEVQRWLTGAIIIPRIELGPTMVPAFVGITQKRPDDAPDEERGPKWVSNWSQFEQRYGGFTNDAILPRSVYGWFANGGRDCCIVPIQAAGVEDPSARPSPPEYIGSESSKTGIHAVASLEGVTALILPDVTTVCTASDGAVDLDSWRSIQREAITVAEQFNCIAILDSPPRMNVQQIRQWRTDVAEYDSRSACLLYPWVAVLDPSGGWTEPIFVPPSGHVGGVWARTDRERGVWRSPANQVITGVLDVEVRLSEAERFILAPFGINPIRALGDWGIRVWGSRTLSADHRFVTLEMARLYSAIRDACSRGLRWSEFEANTVATRSKAKRQIETFLTGLWRAGALVGDRQSEAFWVQCEEGNSTEGLHVQVGIAAEEPSYFLRLGFGRRYGERGAILG